MLLHLQYVCKINNIFVLSFGIFHCLSRPATGTYIGNQNVRLIYHVLISLNNTIAVRGIFQWWRDCAVKPIIPLLCIIVNVWTIIREYQADFDIGVLFFCERQTEAAIASKAP